MAIPSFPVHPLQIHEIQVKEERPPYDQFLVVLHPVSLIFMRISPPWHYNSMHIQSYIYIGVAIRCTVKGSLIVFTVERSGKGVSPASYSAFYRKLYGYNNSSHYGKYHSRVPGFLDRIGYIKYANGVLC